LTYGSHFKATLHATVQQSISQSRVEKSLKPRVQGMFENDNAN